MQEKGAGTPVSLIDGTFNISKFSGDDKIYSSNKWAQDIEDNAEIFGWSPQQTLIVARRTLTGTAELWLRSEKTYKTFEDLKNAVCKEFPDTVNIKEMHEIMGSRKKRKDESLYHYMLTMKELGKRAKFPDYVAIQYIVDGIEDFEYNKSVLYGVTTYSALKEKLTIYEKIKSKSKEVRKDRVSYQQQFVPMKRRCYNCGSIDHVASACKNGLKCFGCNQYGHIRPNCKMQNGANTSSNQGDKMAVSASASGGSSNNRRSAMFGTMTTNDSARGEFQDGNRGVGVPNSFDIPTKQSDNDSSIVTLNPEVNAVVNNSVLCNKKPIKVVYLNDISVNALIDSGSDVNLISMSLFTKLKLQICDDNLILSGLGQSQVRSAGKTFINLKIDSRCYENIVFHVVINKVMPYDVIIGQEFLSSVTMLMNEGVVTFLPQSYDWIGKIDCFVGCSDVVLDHIKDSRVKDEVARLVREYKPLQTEEAPIKLKIVLKDSIPVAQRPRRLSLLEQQVVEQQIKEWLQAGIIRVSFSEYASPLVLVKKKNGETRVCVDYRLLNKKIVKDEFPLPVIDDLIDKLQDARVFSVLDLKNGFFHLKVSEESIQYTSFVTHQGQYEFMRAPFGLSICPKTFMRFVSIVFRELMAQGILMIFIDDIIIPAIDEEQALYRLNQVLEVASRYGLELNWKKANLLQREIEYLGHVIKNGEVRPSLEKVDAVMKYPEPRNLKQLHTFIGLTGYFRKYIENYAAIAKPLTDLLRKDKEFLFQDNERIAFETLKSKLASKPVIKIFDPKLKTELHTDASSVALAAILMQYHPNSGLHPVHYMSRKTNDIQSRYSSYELEALAIIEGIKKFRHYLYGIHFKLVTDCQAFEMTLRKKDVTAKVARWVMMLNEYDFEVEHRAGYKMKHTDALSRSVAVITSLKDGIIQAQENDEGLKAIKTILNEKQYDDFWIENGVLYKGNQKQLVIPRSMEKEIINRVHSNGHFGKTKMKELLSRDYYIRDIDKKIDEFMLSCIPCLLAHRKEGKQEGFLNPIEKDSIPFDTLHIDHVGPLTETKKQYNYILTVIDAFTKFVWLFPTKTTSSSETLKRLQIHQQAFGNPRRIITDRGTAFTSRDFQSYCEEENILHVKITTGVPRGNGQVERVHRIIIPILTKLCVENPSVWYKHVSRVQRALNSTFQRGINTTPFELLMGTKMRNREDVEILSLLQEEIISEFNESRENLRMQAKEQILKIQDENRKHFNKNRKESIKYAEGDLVAIKRTQFGPGLKLKPKYLGPYKVVKCNRNDRYHVEKADSTAEGPIRTSSSADQMKRWPEQSGPEELEN